MKAGIKGCAETEYGRRLMYKMLKTWNTDWYCKVAGHGFKNAGGKSGFGQRICHPLSGDSDMRCQRSRPARQKV